MYNNILGISDLRELVEKVSKLSAKDLKLYNERLLETYQNNRVAIYGLPQSTTDQGKEFVDKLMGELNTIPSLSSSSLSVFLEDARRINHNLRCQGSTLLVGYIPPPDPPKKPDGGG